MQLPKQIGPYQIIGYLGAGGMGHVYRARRINAPSAAAIPDVALKTLLPGLADNQDMVARFLREAEALRKLRHPHIVETLDSGTADGHNYIAMTLLEDGSLAQWLKDMRAREAQVGIDDALTITRQLALALDYAHENGFVHRDVKPGNVLRGPDGRWLLGDFGLVLMQDRTRITQSAHFLGTPAYASPEQILGANLDGRSDIYSLGVVLYEMLTGGLPYASTALPALMNAVLHDPPAKLTRFRPDAPPAVRELIDRALAKKPELRYQTAGQMISAVDTVRQSQLKALPMPRQARLGTAVAIPPRASTSVFDSIRARPAWFAGIFLVALIGAAVCVVAAVSGRGILGTSATQITTVVTARTADVPTQPPVAVADTVTVEVVIPVATTAPIAIIATSTPGRSQDRSHTITITLTRTPLPTASMASVVATGTAIASPEPAMLIQGKIAFESGVEGNRQIYIANLANGQVTLLPMQPQNSRVPSWSPDGNYLAFRSRISSRWQIYTIRIDGSELRQLTKTGGNYEGVWSPDGAHMAFVSDRDGNKEIYIMNADGKDQRRLTNNPGRDDDPSWAPDGQMLAFESERNGRTDIYVASLDGKQLSRLTMAGDGNYTPAWSADGNWIAFEQATGGAADHYAIWRMRTDGKELQRLTFDETDAGRATWSPSGRHIAYTSNRDGTYGIWILAVDSKKPPIRLSVLEGYNASWSHGQ